MKLFQWKIVFSRFIFLEQIKDFPMTLIRLWLCHNNITYISKPIKILQILYIFASAFYSAFSIEVSIALVHFL